MHSTESAPGGHTIPLGHPGRERSYVLHLPPLSTEGAAPLLVQLHGRGGRESIGPDVTVRTWQGPSRASDVVFYRIDGGGHTWPGSRQLLPGVLFGRTSQTISATDVIWRFFSSHVRSAVVADADRFDG